VPGVIDTYDPDPCCGKRLSEALLSGRLDEAQSWQCPKCGTQWKPRRAAEVRVWEPVPDIEVWPI